MGGIVSFVEFRVLGPLQASKGDRPLPLGGPKQRALLANLLLRANRVVAADALIEEIWGDEPPPAAKSALQAYVSRLRHALGRDRIEGRAPGYALRADPDEVDVLRFERLVSDARRLLTTDPGGAVDRLDQALGLWRGPLLADLPDALSLEVERARLDELRLSALEERVEAQLSLGRDGQLVAELDALAQQHPLRERLWGLLMLALYREGRQAEALATYRRARDLLADELGVDPSPELAELHERVLRQDPALDFSGRPLRGYRLQEQIGEGSFGVVFRASQPQVGRDVAVKVIHPRLANHSQFIRRFESEAQLVARLEHPHIVPLYDYWREPGGAYLVMRLLSGGSLKDRLGGGSVGPDAVAEITNHVAMGLAAAHRAGVIHRDVKPANILFDDEGNAYLSDFGIASYVTAAGQAGPGTPGTLAYYSSPEEIRGGPLTPRADIYSLGLVLYEALTGHHPFGDASPAVVAEKHLREPIPSVRDARPELPKEIDEILRTATEKDPSDRYEDAPALASAFVRALRPAPTLPIVRSPKEVRNPYKGLRPFLEADADDFFGREAITQTLVARLAEDSGGSRFLAVVGASGSGKSSIVQAGLIPALKQGDLAGSESWFVVGMFPGSRPFEELESALLKVAAEPPTCLLDDLMRDERGLIQAAERLLPADESELVVIVDQFEEVFTLLDDEEEQRRFLAVLLEAATGLGSRVRIVVTLRADFYDRPLLHKEFGDLLASRTVAVTPPSVDELEGAVLGPAEGAGVRVEPELVAEMVADVRGQPGALPLFQYALTEVFERRKGATLTAEAYREIGGVAGALARRAEELYGSFDAAGQGAARQLFLRLIAVGEGTAETRRRVLLPELTSLEVDQEALRAVIEAFGTRRLLSFDRDPTTRVPTVEVAHEALLGEWSRLRGWVEAAREDVRMHRRLAAALGEWLEAEKDPGFLLRGSRLDQFGSWGATTMLALTGAERGYLEASLAQRRDEESREEARRAHERTLERRSVARLRAFVAVLTAAALVAGGLTIIAFRERGKAQRQSEAAARQGRRAEAQARIATARELAAAAVANLDVDPERSILLALESVQTTRDVDGTVLRESEEALHRALQTSRVIFTLPQGGGVEFSPEGTRLGTTGEEGATIWETETGQELLKLEGHRGPVANLVFSTNGSRIATTGEDGTVRLWDANSGSELAAFSGGSVISPALSPDGTLLAASDFDGTVRVWDTSSEEEVFALRESSPVGLDFSPDGTRLAVASLDEQAAVVWDMTSGRRLLELDGHSGGVVDVVFSPDGAYIATASDDLLAKIWDATSGKELRTLEGHSGFLFGIDVDVDGALVATGSEDGTAKVWDAETGRELLTLAGHSAGIGNVAFSPDGSQLATGSGDGTTKVWDITPEGSRELLTVAGHTDVAFEAAFSPDGDRMATVSWDETVKVWDVPSGEEVLTLAGHDDRVFRVAFGPDGARLATASQDGTARVWDVATGKELLRLEANLGDLPGLAYGPEGLRLVTGARDGTVDVWDASTGRRELQLRSHAEQVPDVAFSPDGARFATASWDGTVRVWDVGSGREMLTIESSGARLNTVAFSPDGRWVAASGFDPDIVLWDAASGEPAMTLTGHSGIVWSVAFSPDGDRLASTGFDGTVRLWSLATGQEALRLTEGVPLASVAFSSDGNHLVSTGEEGLARVYILDIEELMLLARDRLSRDLTNEECKQYLHRDECPAR